MSTSRPLPLDGDNLTLDDAEAILSGHVDRVSLTAESRTRVVRSLKCVTDLLAKGATIYGVNTGFGKLSGTRIAPEDALALQENLLRSHAVGRGPLLAEGVSRLALALRVQALAKGLSGVTPGLLDALVDLFNAGIAPAIPCQGSVGASGDLAPLAHMALLLVGEGRALVREPRRPLRTISGKRALRQAGLRPYRLQVKEGLALINGTQISTAILVDALVRARQLARTADVIGAMTVEATKSSQRPFDPRIQAARPHPGQADCAVNLRRLLTDSEVMRSHAGCPKVQDAYSLRCMPQVHGTFRDALSYVSGVAEREMNSATDNPLVFADSGEVISGGNFHAQPVALAADLLSAAAADMASVSERRVENLVNPDLSGLPGFLTPQPGLNSGMMIVQVLAAALVSEAKANAFPAGVDSIPTSANREDHVSMATLAARKARRAVGLLTRVLACEVLCAAQGLDFHRPLRAGRGVEGAHRCLRDHVPALERDRPLHRDLAAAERLVRSGSLLIAAEVECGALE
jgi:histidine ammonia-lyase